MMCIVNFAFGISGRDVAHAVLNDQAAVENLIRNVLAIMRRKGTAV
jgi:spore germination protein YaaH